MRKYVISLARTPTRLQQFLAANEHLKNIEVFEAIDGAELAGTDAKYFANDLKYTPGAIGCALSHIALWQQVAASGKPAIIFEDDTVVHKNFEQAALRVLSQLPIDWDFIALGWNFNCPAQIQFLPGVTPSQVVFQEVGIKDHLPEYQDLSMSVAAYPLHWCFGTPGYAISKAGAEKLLKMLLPLRRFTMHTSVGDAENKGIDVALNTAYVKIKAYASFPPLVITPNDKASSTVVPEAGKVAA